MNVLRLIGTLLVATVMCTNAGQGAESNLNALPVWAPIEARLGMSAKELKALPVPHSLSYQQVELRCSDSSVTPRPYSTKPLLVCELFGKLFDDLWVTATFPASMTIYLVPTGDEYNVFKITVVEPCLLEDLTQTKSPVGKEYPAPNKKSARTVRVGDRMLKAVECSWEDPAVIAHFDSVARTNPVESEFVLQDKVIVKSILDAVRQVNSRMK